MIACPGCFISRFLIDNYVIFIPFGILQPCTLQIGAQKIAVNQIQDETYVPLYQAGEFIGEMAAGGEDNRLGMKDVELARQKFQRDHTGRSNAGPGKRTAGFARVGRPPSGPR